MKRRVSKVEAERILNKSRATIDRMISRGELETELAVCPGIIFRRACG